MKLKLLITVAMSFMLSIALAQSVETGSNRSFKIGSEVSTYPEVKWLKGNPILRFDASKTYIIECWATWCGPCMGAIPHLNELHKKYGDKITIVGQGVMENDLKKVERFVNSKGDDMAYSVAYAGGNSSDFSQKWLIPAGVSSIPFTFVIQNNKVIWTPSPSELTDEAIQLLIDGKFSQETLRIAQNNRETAAAEELMKLKKYNEAITELDRVLLNDPYNKNAVRLKCRALEQSGDSEKAFSYFEDLHNKGLSGETFWFYYRALRKRNQMDKLLEVISKDFDRAQSANSPLVMDVVSEGFKIYSERNDYGGLMAYIEKVLANSKSSSPLFAILAISPYYPNAVANKSVRNVVFKTAMKQLETGQIEFHYLNEALKMFWKHGEEKLSIELIQKSITNGKKEGLPNNKLNAMSQILAFFKRGELPTNEEFKKLEKEAIQ